jgi:hypothetical protein
MGQVLHGSATTTTATRRAMQKNNENLFHYRIGTPIRAADQGRERCPG